MQGTAGSLSNQIAIVGLACRVPGARDVEAFWENLCAGICSVEQFERRNAERDPFTPIDSSAPQFVAAAGCLEDIDCFDAGFFDMSPREAQVMDPQHRVFLECAWHALEDAAIDTTRYDGVVGVVAGTTMSRYIQRCLSRQDILASIGIDSIALGNNVDFLPTMASYKLNLTGPSLAIQTGCSTSLVAVHVASQMLLNHESDLVLAGGAAVHVPQRTGYVYAEGGIVSPDGRCCAFDAEARGTVFGSGVGVVVLQRLEDALRLGSRIRAVIRGTAVNNDGHRKAGFTAPSIDGQSKVIVECQAVAGVPVDTIGHVEAHGTGTRVGDPIELSALTRAFRRHTQRRQFCAVTSLKPNVGHLDAAAGIAGLIKTTLMLERAQIPPSLNFNKPNPQFDLHDSPFFINTRLRDWPSTGLPRRAGVSSFGIGGTNSHAILEEAPPPEPTTKGRSFQVLPLSARTPAALESSCRELAAMLQVNQGIDIADVAYTLAVGRKAFECRRRIVCMDEAEAAKALLQFDTRIAAHPVAGECKCVFMFPGQGTQLVDAGRELYKSEATFRKTIDECASVLLAESGIDICKLLRAEADQYAGIVDLTATELAQPVLFSVQYALAQLWMSWGVKPYAVVGHSLGEYVAACLAGVFSLPNALRLVCERGRLMQGLPRGRMLSVALSESELLGVLPEHVSLAAVNGTSACVASGPAEGIAILADSMRRRGVWCSELKTSHAFHSPMMARIAQELKAAVHAAKPKRPELPMLSGVTGNWIAESEAADPAYWVDHLVKPVRFFQGIKTVGANAGVVLLEVGWGSTLSTLASAALPGDMAAVASSLPRSGQTGEVRELIDAVGQVWEHGASVDWAAFYRSQRRSRIRLPGYPFARERHWIDAVPPASAALAMSEKTAPLDDVCRFYQPAWYRKANLSVGRSVDDERSTWLVVLNGSAIADQVVKAMKDAGEAVIVVRSESGTPVADEENMVVRLDHKEDHRLLMQALRRRNLRPGRIVYFLGEDHSHKPQDRTTGEDFGGFYGPLFMLQALAEKADRPMSIWLLSTSAYDVVGDELPSPSQAMPLALCRVAAQELAHLACRQLDLPDVTGGSDPRLPAAIAGELLSDPDDMLIALRAGQRWVFDVEPIAPPDQAKRRLRQDGVYLITGGLGRFGLIIARHLAVNYKAAVILTTRSVPPNLALETDDVKTQARVRELRELKRIGARVEVVQADVGNEGQMLSLVSDLTRRYGALHGVVHAAGIIGSTTHRSIVDSDKHHCDEMFQAKVFGTLALGEALRGIPLDFVVTISSLSPLLGGLGLAGYAAANHFMDGFVDGLRRKGDVVWQSVNWEGWEVVGSKVGPGAYQGERAEFAMSEAEIVNCFEQTLAMQGLQRIVIARGNLKERMQRWAKVPRSTGVVPADAAAKRDAKADAMATIRAMAESLLGISDLQDDDDLLERGANSLTAVQLIARVRETFDVNLPMRALFENPTVSHLATAVKERLGHGTDRLVDLLQEIEGLPDAEAESLLLEEGGVSADNLSRTDA